MRDVPAQIGIVMLIDQPFDAPRVCSRAHDFKHDRAEIIAAAAVDQNRLMIVDKMR